MEKNKKRILYIITHLELGGAQKQLFLLIQNINKEKYSVSLLSGNKGFLKEKANKLDCLDGIEFIPQLVREINPFLDVVAIYKIYRYIKKNGFDLVHVHSPKASVIGRWAAFCAGVKKVVYTVHGWPFHSYMSPVKSWLYKVVEKATARLTHKIIVVSRSDLDKGLKNKIAKVDKFELIHYGIDAEKFSLIYQDKKKDRDENLVLSVSSLKPQKGLIFLIDAAAELVKENPRLKFLIIGDGPIKNYLKSKINKAGLKEVVILKGWVDDISSYLGKASLFVLSSLWEGLPISLIEAVVSGVPVVVTDTGGQKDILNDLSQGIVVKPASGKELVSAVLNVLKNSDYWSRIITNNRKNIDLSYWSYSRMIKETEKVYLEV